MNFSAQPPARNTVWQQFKKMNTNLPLHTEKVQVVSACSFIQNFQGKRGPYRREMLELGLALYGSDGKLTENMIMLKIKGAPITDDGQSGECPLELWNVLKLLSIQNPNFMNEPQSGMRMNEPCRFYPGMIGAVLVAVFATTGTFNGYFVNTVEVFDPETKRSGLEINNGAQVAADIEQSKKRISEDHDRFTGTVQAATGGFGGWNQQPQNGVTGGFGNPQPQAGAPYNPPKF